MAAFSCFLSKTMDCFGYNSDIVQGRRHLETTDKITNGIRTVSSRPTERTLVGSRGEGTVSFLSISSDWDYMHILKDVICVEQAQDDVNFHKLESDLNGDTFPGYTRVVYKNHRDIREDFCSYDEEFCLNLFFNGNGFLLSSSESQYISNKGGNYLSNPLFKDELFQEYIYCFPSVPPVRDKKIFEFVYTGPAFTFDNVDEVFAIYYFETKYLKKWKTRMRLYEWPTSTLITDISTSEGYIVPVGHKSSENHYLEWRICFTTAELKLIQNMTSVQLQLYMLLKMVKRHFLAPLSKGITSYVIKNIVFWISETTPIRLFTPSNLVNLLKKSLRFLAFCIRNNHLPNYMIPDRNILHGALEVLERTHVLKVLSDLLQNVEKFLLEIPEIRKFMSCAFRRPDCVSLYGPWRDSVEKLLIAMKCLEEKRLLFIFDVNESNPAEIALRCYSDPDYLPIMTNLLNLIVPDWNFLILNKRYDECTNIFERNCSLLEFGTP